MTVTPIRKRTAAALNAGHAATAASLDRARAALQQMKHEHAKITVAAVARRADVSRTFLYQNAAARQLITESVAGERARRTQARSAHAARIEASWRERALNAEDGLKAAHHEILTQRSTIGELVGKIRDLEADLPEDGVQRLIREHHIEAPNPRAHPGSQTLPRATASRPRQQLLPRQQNCRSRSATCESYQRI